MSVALQSPFQPGTKRLFEDAAEEEGQQHQEAAKRARCLGSPAGRCRPASHASPSHFQPSLPASAVAAVKALFPGMDAQVGLLGPGHCLRTEGEGLLHVATSGTPPCHRAYSPVMHGAGTPGADGVG